MINKQRGGTPRPWALCCFLRTVAAEEHLELGPLEVRSVRGAGGGERLPREGPLRSRAGEGGGASGREEEMSGRKRRHRSDEKTQRSAAGSGGGLTTKRRSLGRTERKRPPIAYAWGEGGGCGSRRGWLTASTLR